VLAGVPRDVGAREEDRDVVLGAREDDREDEVLWVPVVFEVPERMSGGRSRIDGGDIDLLPLPYRNGDGRRLWLGAGRDKVLGFARG